MKLCSENGLEPVVKTFNHVINLCTIGCSTVVGSFTKIHSVLPRFRFKLSASISNDSGSVSKMCNPSRKESTGQSFTRLDGNGDNR